MGESEKSQPSTYREMLLTLALQVHDILNAYLALDNDIFPSDRVSLWRLVKGVFKAMDFGGHQARLSYLWGELAAVRAQAEALQAEIGTTDNFYDNALRASLEEFPQWADDLKAANRAPSHADRFNIGALTERAIVDRLHPGAGGPKTEAELVGEILAQENEDFVRALVLYCAVLSDAIGFLAGICGHLAKKSQRVEEYPAAQYELDIGLYRTLVEKYQSVGTDVNRFF